MLLDAPTAPGRVEARWAAASNVAGNLEREIEAAAGVIARRLAGAYTSLLLTGTAARGEQTADHLGRLVSDIDFLVVLPQRHPLKVMLAERRCGELLRGYESELPPALRGLTSVGFMGSHPRFWRQASPFMYELKSNARCIHGSVEVLDWPRVARAAQIPAWEGVRLVANRLCGMLGALAQYVQVASPTAEVGPDPELALRYAAMKQPSVCCDGVLAATGLYAATYRERLQSHLRVAHLFNPIQNSLIRASYSAKLGEGDDGPFPYDPLDMVRHAARLTLHTLALMRAGSPADIARAARHANPAAPGAASDLFFFARQAASGRRVPVRRAISSVYGHAVELAVEFAWADPAPEAFERKAAELYRRFKSTPQTVGMI
jgi:hypothetical protein